MGLCSYKEYVVNVHTKDLNSDLGAAKNSNKIKSHKLYCMFKNIWFKTLMNSE